METLSGTQIRALRNAMEMTQKAFGKEFGVTNTNVSEWENDRRKPQGDVASQLYQAYNQFFEATGARIEDELAEAPPTTVKVLDTLDTYINSMRIPLAARKVAEEYNIDSTSFREAVIVLCYYLGEMSAADLAEALRNNGS